MPGEGTKGLAWPVYEVVSPLIPLSQLGREVEWEEEGLVSLFLFLKVEFWAIVCI